MFKRPGLIILGLLLIVYNAACQPAQGLAPTDTPSLPVVTEINTPTPTHQPEPLPTLPPTSEPSPTSQPEPPGDTPQCFTPIEILPFAFLPDNSRLLIRSGSGVQVFDLESLREESFLNAPQNVVTAAISPDGNTLAWSLEDNSIQLVRLSDQQPLATLTGHPDIVYHLKFSPAGDRLYSASHDGIVRVWDLEGKLVSTVEAGGEVVGMGISPDGSRLATIPSDGPLVLWDVATGEVVAEFGSASGYDTSEAVFSPDGQYLAADLATGLYLWQISDGELLWNEVKNSMTVAFSPDGKYLAYSDIDNANINLSSPDGAQIVRTLGQMQSPVWELFFSPDGALLVATDGVEIQIWQVEDGQLIYTGKPACP